MTQPLTSRERVNRMMEHRDHDRIPRHETFWPETLTRWEGEGLEGGEQAVLDLLGSDFASLTWCWPKPFPGADQIVSEDEETKVVRDGHGRLARYWKHKSGTPEHLGFECETPEIWEKKFKPALLENWLQPYAWPPYLDAAAIKARFEKLHADGKWTHLTGVEPFEQTRCLMGDEITLIAMAEEPEWVADVAAITTDILLRNYDALFATGIRPDGLWIYGDMAFKSATMCSPAMYKELIWPQHKRIVDWAHSHGMKFIYHTDGDVNGVIDLYIEAGFDCLQPLETKASMDIRKLCPKYSDRLSFFGNIDVMKMITNDLDLIEEEIISKFAAGMAGHNYCYHSDHSVPPQVSWKTYQEIIRMVERHGNY